MQFFDFTGTDFTVFSTTVTGSTTNIFFQDGGISFVFSAKAEAFVSYNPGGFSVGMVGTTASFSLAIDNTTQTFVSAPSFDLSYLSLTSNNLLSTVGSTGSKQVLSGATATPTGFIASSTAPFAIGDSKITFVFFSNSGGMSAPFFILPSLTANISCFTDGTLIDTPTGPRAVEDLSEGDLVLTDQGPEPLIWTGATQIDPRFAPENHHPIRITKNALGPNMPSADLTLSPDHAVALDGLLVTAGALVNGTTIRQIQATEPFTYHHIATAKHSLLTAHNTPCESYCASGATAFGPDQPAIDIPEMDRPRIASSAQLARLRPTPGIAA